MMPKINPMQRAVERIMNPVPEKEGGVSNRELTLHAMGLIGQNHTWNMVQKLPYFCNTVMEIDSGLTGWFTGVSRIWDAVNDPIIGAYMDKHRFKNGEKLRPYLKITSPLVGVFSTLLFVNFGFASPVLTMAVITVLYLLFDTCYSFQDVSIWGITAMVSPHSDERARAAQWAGIGASLGTLLPGLITPLIGFRDKLPFGMTTLFLLLAIFFCFGGSMMATLSYT